MRESFNAIKGHGQLKITDFFYFILIFLVGHQKLKQLLSFAIGGLLGDVFLHLLPEAWANSGASGVWARSNVLHRAASVPFPSPVLLVHKKMTRFQSKRSRIETPCSGNTVF